MDHIDHREEILVDHPHGFDPSEPKGSAIAIFGVLVIVTLIATVVFVQFYFDRTHEEQVYVEQLAPAGQQLEDLHTREDAQLYSYGYLDRAKGSVRVPINRAMELLTKESAENRLLYPTKPEAVKTPEQLAAGAGAPAQTGAQPQAPAQGAAPAPNNQAPGSAKSVPQSNAPVK